MQTYSFELKPDRDKAPANTVCCRLTFIKQSVRRSVSRDVYAWYKCLCGTVIETIQSKVKNGYIKSCGCLHHELARERMRLQKYKLVHGMYGTPEYSSYKNAKKRCNNSNAPRYDRYGGRGIKFLFNSFEEFYKELGPRPLHTSLDRIDNDGHYEKGNVRWSTPIEQVHNRRSA